MSIFDRYMSEVYTAAPVTLFTTSTFGRLLPTTLSFLHVAGAGISIFFASGLVLITYLPPHLFCGAEYRKNGFRISRTPADVAGDGYTHLFFRRIGIFVKVCLRGEDHARRAVAALNGRVLYELFLQRMKAALAREPLYSHDIGAVGFRGVSRLTQQQLTQAAAQCRAARLTRHHDLAACSLQVVAQALDLRGLPYAVNAFERNEQSSHIYPLAHSVRDGGMRRGQAAIAAAATRLYSAVFFAAVFLAVVFLAAVFSR